VSFISRDSPGKWYSFKSVNEGQPIYISNHFTWQKWNDKIHNESINYTPLKERHFLYYTFFFTSTKKAFCLCVEVKEREREIDYFITAKLTHIKTSQEVLTDTNVVVKSASGEGLWMDR